MALRVLNGEHGYTRTTKTGDGFDFSSTRKVLREEVEKGIMKILSGENSIDRSTGVVKTGFQVPNPLFMRIPP